MGQPICDFRRRNPQSRLYVNSGSRPERVKHWSFRDSFSAQAFRGAVPRVGTRMTRMDSAARLGPPWLTNRSLGSLCSLFVENERGGLFRGL
jgi:hypothetical protein